MKKLVSLFIALLLIVSLFATMSVVAFAEEGEDPAEPTEPVETPERTPVVFRADYFWALDDIKSLSLVHASTREFTLNNAWTEDAGKVAGVFDGSVDTDKITFEYCSQSTDYKQDWSEWNLDKKVSIGSSTGWWGFRYVLKDSDKKLLAKTDAIYIYFGDETAPAITGLSSAMDDLHKDGLDVGKTYSIKTNLSITEDSSYSTTYVVLKLVKDEWVQIFDSTTSKVEEGYEDCISTGGVITALKSDVMVDSEGKTKNVYTIRYTVKDAYGYTSETMDLTFGVNAEKKTVNPTDVWKIVLYVVAGLSLVGIIVVLFIKPKEPEVKNVGLEDSEK